MPDLIRQIKLVLFIALVPVVCSLTACSSREAFTENSFVGKWRSSRATTPMYIHRNGEWEIKTDDGRVLQYGVWQLKDRHIVWSYKVDSNIGHDSNPVLSVTAREFKVQESNGSTTTFSKLD